MTVPLYFRRYTGGTHPVDRKSTRLHSSHTNIYTLSLHDALPISPQKCSRRYVPQLDQEYPLNDSPFVFQALHRRNSSSRSEEHTSALQSHQYLHSFPTRRSSDLSTEMLPKVRSTIGSGISSE